MVPAAPPGQLNNAEQFRALLEGEGATTPRAKVGDQDKEYISQEEENSFMRAVADTVNDRPEALAAVIANTVGNGLAEAHQKALMHASRPFCDDNTVMVFGKDGSITTERLPHEPHDQGIQGSSNKNGSNEDVQGNQLRTESQGHEALPKIKQKLVGSKTWYRIFVVYSGELPLDQVQKVYMIAPDTAFKQVMKIYPSNIKLPPTHRLEYCHGPYALTGEDTLLTLANDNVIYLDNENDFVVYAYDHDDEDEDEDEDPLGDEDDPPGDKKDSDEKHDEEASEDEEDNEDEEVSEEEDDNGQDEYLPAEEYSEDEVSPPKRVKLGCLHGPANSGARAGGRVSSSLASQKKKAAANAGAPTRAAAKNSAASTSKAVRAPGNPGDDDDWMDGADDAVTTGSSQRHDKSKGRKKDTRKGRGDRKRPSGSYPRGWKNQMDVAVRQHLDGSDGAIHRAQLMATPRCFQDGYDADLSETDSIAGEKRWPRVIVGQFFYTEQQANPSGGGATKVYKTPQLHFNTGSVANRKYFGKQLKNAMAGKKDMSFSFHEQYENLKQAVFGHESIKQPQENNVKKRRINRRQKENK